MQLAFKTVTVLLVLSALSCSGFIRAQSTHNARAGSNNATRVLFDKTSSPTKALLSVDGGGLRCVIAVEVLFVVEQAIIDQLKSQPKFGLGSEDKPEILLSDYFAAFTGANCGAWVASYLASNCGNFACRTVLKSALVVNRYGHVNPGSVEGLKVFFNEFSSMIYPRAPNRLAQLPRVTLRPPWCIPGLTCALNPAGSYRSALLAFLGTDPMENFPAMLILPTFDLIRRAVVVFASYSARHVGTDRTHTYVFDTDTNPRPSCLTGCPKSGAGAVRWETTVEVIEGLSYSLLDVAQAAGSRVIVHPAHTFNTTDDDPLKFVAQDTSLLFNNPLLAGITVMDDMYSGVRSSQLTNISILSIGTGFVDGSLAYQARSGAYQWMMQTQDFYDVAIHGSSELIQSQIDMLIYSVLSSNIFSKTSYMGQYMRIQTEAAASTPVGEVLLSSMQTSYLDELTSIGAATGAEFRESIQDFVKTFIFGIDIDEHRFDLDKAKRICANGGSRTRRPGPPPAL